MSRVPLPLTDSVADRSYEEYVAQEPTSQSEATGAAFDLAMADTAVGLLARGGIAREFNQSGAAPLTPEEANQRYPGMKTPFREEVNPYTAQMLSDREEETAKLHRKISMGPQDNWSKSKQFGAGLMAHLMDPVEFGAGALSGWAIGGLAARGAFGMRAAIATDMVAAGARVSTGTRLAVNAGEGFIGAAVENTAQEIGQAAVEGAESFDSGRTTGDVLTDWAVGTFAAGALSVGIKEIARGLGGLKRALRSTSPEADLAIARNTLQTFDSDTIPSAEPVMHALAQETSVLPQSFGHAAYQFEPVSRETVQTKVFYASTTDANPDLKLGAKADLGDGYGFGTHITDNPGVANAASARSMADSTGMVHQVQINGEVRPLPLGVNAGEDLELARGLAELAGGTIDDVADLPFREVLSGIREMVDQGILPPKTLDDVQELIKSRGYNALIDDGSTRLGQAHEPHNHLILLDDELVGTKQAFEPDSNVVRVPTEMELQAAAKRLDDPNTKFFVNMDEHAINVEAVEHFRAEAKEDLASVSRVIDEGLEEIDELHAQGFYGDEEALALRTRIMDTRKLNEEKHTLLKMFKACAGV